MGKQRPAWSSSDWDRRGFALGQINNYNKILYNAYKTTLTFIYFYFLIKPRLIDQSCIFFPSFNETKKYLHIFTGVNNTVTEMTNYTLAQKPHIWPVSNLLKSVQCHTPSLNAVLEEAVSWEPSQSLTACEQAFPCNDSENLAYL